MAVSEATRTANVVRQMHGSKREVHSGMPRNPFWERMSERLPFVDKEELSKKGDVFVITRCTYRQAGKYGPQWWLNILRESNENTDGYAEMLLTFPATPGREPFFAALSDELRTGQTIPAQLVVFSTENGDAYGLSEPAEDAQLSFTFTEPSF